MFSLDPTLLQSADYPEYMSIYQFFPNPPGVEFFNPRNKQVDLKGPWILEPTEYPIPPLPTSTITFEDAADSFGSEIVAELNNGKQVYMMWSGGIDSTSIATSVLLSLIHI